MHTATNDTVSILLSRAHLPALKALRVGSPGNANREIGVPGRISAALSRASILRAVGATARTSFHRFVDLENYGLLAEEFRGGRVKTERRELPEEKEFAPFC
jgi:hypothetical protein